MAKFLDSTGLNTLWTKIKKGFLSLSSGGIVNTNGTTNIVIKDGGLYLYDEEMDSYIRFQADKAPYLFVQDNNTSTCLEVRDRNVSFGVPITIYPSFVSSNNYSITDETGDVQGLTVRRLFNIDGYYNACAVSFYVANGPVTSYKLIESYGDTTIATFTPQFVASKSHYCAIVALPNSALSTGISMYIQET